MADSRLLIACSRRILNRAWEISGASDGEAQLPINGSGAYWPPYELACFVRDKIKSGKLSVLPNARCWAGPATGKLCVVCDVRIFGGAECKVGKVDSAVFAHLVCHSLWCQESQAQSREQDHSAAS